jgi:uncharacterized protein (TIGR03083 family)
MTTLLDFPTYLEHIRTESARFRAALTDCDPAARVPACPDWDAADLVWHLAEVQWFWAKTVRTRPAAPDEVDVPAPARPDSYAELLQCFDDFSHALVTELERAEPAEEAWHWSSDHTVGMSYRRQAHEALIHRLDAEETAGTLTGLDPELAADGVHEALAVMYGGCPPWGTLTPASDQVVLIRTTDTGDEVRVVSARFTGTDPDSGKTYDDEDITVVEDDGTSPAATVSGTAADLDTWLWHRGAGRVTAGRDGGSQVAFDGDQAVLGRVLVSLSQPID